MPPQGAAAGCCFEVLLSHCRRCRVPLQGAAAGCRCRVPLQGAAAGCRCTVPLHGAAAGCRWRVPEGCIQLRNLGGATRCCCQSVVCAVKLGCWGRCLRDAYGNVGVEV